MYHKCMILFFSVLLLFGCEKNSTDVVHDSLNGVWRNAEELPAASIEGSWIPTNLHITDTDEENVLRVRILDPIACTDSYPTISNSRITFSQYGLTIQVKFETDNKGTLSAEKDGTTVSFSIHKTDDAPYWGPCD